MRASKRRAQSFATARAFWASSEKSVGTRMVSIFMAWIPSSGSSFALAVGSGGGREPESKAGALPRLALDLDRSVMVEHDGAADDETEAGSLPALLARVEGLEDPIHGVGVDSMARVLDRDVDGVGLDGRDRHRELPSFGHGVGRIHEEVQERLLEPIPVSMEDRRRLDPTHHLDPAVAQLLAEEVQSMLEHLLDLNGRSHHLAG